MSFYSFAQRHIGPDKAQTKSMLKAVGVTSMEKLISKVVPAHIRLDRALLIPDAMSEAEYMEHIWEVANKTKCIKTISGWDITIVWCRAWYCVIFSKIRVGIRPILPIRPKFARSNRRHCSITKQWCAILRACLWPMHRCSMKPLPLPKP